MRYAHLSPDVKRDAVRLLDGPVAREGSRFDSGPFHGPTLTANGEGVPARGQGTTANGGADRPRFDRLTASGEERATSGQEQAPTSP